VSIVRTPFVRTLVSLAAALLAAGSAQAMSFAEAFAAARQNDANLRAAGHELEAARQAVPVARAPLLPQVSMSASRNEVSGSKQFFNSLNQEVKTQLEYASPYAALQMRMPLFNRELHSRYEYSQAQLDVAESDFRTRQLELVSRLGSAYFQVLLAEENLTLAQQQQTLAQGQLARAEKRFERGEGTLIERAQSRAAVDIAQVRILESRDELANARRALRRLTGRDTPTLNRPLPSFAAQALLPERLGEWLDIALRNSPQVQSRQQSVISARLGVQTQSAGHMPRVDLVASISRAENDQISNLGQTNVLKSLGVQVNVPLYAGGGVQASVRQALALQAKAEEELRAAREAVEIEVQRHFQSVTNGGERLTAHERAVQSAEVQLRGFTRAQEAGMGTTADVLESQTLLFSTRRDLAKARYEYLLARLLLKAQSGLAIDDMINDVDSQLPATHTASK
jgi:outer membrane protein, protease secretion system